MRLSRGEGFVRPLVRTACGPSRAGEPAVQARPVRGRAERVRGSARQQGCPARRGAVPSRRDVSPARQEAGCPEVLRGAPQGRPRIALHGLRPPEQGRSARRSGARQGATRARPLLGRRFHPRDGSLLPRRGRREGQGRQRGGRLLHARREALRHKRHVSPRQPPQRVAALRVRQRRGQAPGTRDLP